MSYYSSFSTTKKHNRIYTVLRRMAQLDPNVEQEPEYLWRLENKPKKKTFQGISARSTIFKLF